MRDTDISSRLLAWYDVNAREMPWRISPQDRKAGIIPDPYRIWLSEIMLQQTTVVTVRDYFIRFITRWPDIASLANAKDADVMGEWAGLGYYARARNLLKCARVIVAEHDAQFPNSHTELLKLPGIGPYTAAAVASIAYDHPETVVDGNVERVMARLHQIETPLPTAKPELTALATKLTPLLRAGDYAQSVMDLGATICTPKSPKCDICPLIDCCTAYKNNTQASLPNKIPKKPKPTRHGTIYVTKRTDGAWLLERRPDKGLLGGMLGWPGSEWGDCITETPPIPAKWKSIDAEVRHTFTHFHLILQVKIATVTDNIDPNAGEFISNANFKPSDLPTVMRKAYDLAATGFVELS